MKFRKNVAQVSLYAKIYKALSFQLYYSHVYDHFIWKAWRIV
jgi:hypothetical protein